LCHLPKKKYRYNPETLSYEEVSRSPITRILRVLLWASPSIVMGILLAYFFTRKLDSPKELFLKKEIEIYRKEIDRLNADITLANIVLEGIQKRDEELYRVALFADEFPEELRNSEAAESKKYAYLDGLTNSSLLQRTSERMDELERRIHGQSVSFKELLNLAKNKDKMLASIPAIQPVSNKNLKQMASGYGYRIDPIYKTRRMHTGMDFTARIGTEVYVTGDGVVESVETSGWGYGKCIVVNHGFGYKTRYAHLSAFKVLRGDKVTRGQLIGLVGNTGKSTGPHLHYEVEHNGDKVNPVHYYHSDITPAQYEKLIQMSQNSFRAFD
jgi:murein DD-endopeptidase MepM/ murein hydrolase activator NlpD